jgi:hypothetical protein
MENVNTTIYNFFIAKKCPAFRSFFLVKGREFRGKLSTLGKF